MCLEGMSFDSAYHAPVLATEVVGLLQGKQRILDGTLGGGGHSEALLAAGARAVIGLGRDPDALAAATAPPRGDGDASRFTALQGNHAGLTDLAALDGVQFDGILLDLGISSHQVDETERGFSFRPGAPLDMRMGPETPSDAAQLLNTEDEIELTTIFK